MTCDRVKLDAAPLATAIVCSRRRRYRCGFCTLAGGLQCDWKITKTKRCDAFICPEHALEVGKNKHICPLHQPDYHAWAGRRAEKTRA